MQNPNLLFFTSASKVCCVGNIFMIALSQCFLCLHSQTLHCQLGMVVNLEINLESKSAYHDLPTMKDEKIAKEGRDCAGRLS